MHLQKQQHLKNSQQVLHKLAQKNLLNYFQKVVTLEMHIFHGILCISNIMFQASALHHTISAQLES